MIRISDKRVWTALVVIALAVYAMRDAASVLGFGVERALATPGTARERLEGFVDSPVVGVFVRRALLEETARDTAAERAEDDAGLLAVAPLSSKAWLDLSVMRVRSGESAAKVAASLALSTLTGPNESWLMSRRAVFALPLWAALPPDSRRAVIADLTNGGFVDMTQAGRATVKLALSIAPDSTREQLRAALLLAGKKGDEMAKVFGLDTPATDAGKGAAPLPANASKPKPDVRPVPPGALSPTPLAPLSGLRPAAQ